MKEWHVMTPPCDRYSPSTNSRSAPVPLHASTMLILCRPGGSVAKPCLPRATYDEGAQPRIALTQFHYVVLCSRHHNHISLSYLFLFLSLSFSLCSWPVEYSEYGKTRCAITLGDPVKDKIVWKFTSRVSLFLTRMQEPSFMRS